MSSVIRLHPRAAAYFLLQKLPLSIFFGVWLAVMLSVAEPLSTHAERAGEWEGLGVPSVRGGVGFMLLIAGVALFCVFKARAYRIELRSEGISLDYGVLNKTQEMLLYGKVQDILVTRSLLERFLGLSTVVVQNAMGTPQRVPGLSVAAATLLRDGILRQCVAGGTT